MARISKLNWNTVDWSLQNVVIASNLGCSHENVRQHRLKKGIPQSPNSHKKLTPPKSKYDWESVDWAMNDKAIAEILGCNKCMPCAIRKKLGIPPAQRPPKKTKYDWGPVDWTTNDYQIARTIGCTPRTAMLHRLKHGIPHHPGYKPRPRRNYEPA